MVNFSENDKAEREFKKYFPIGVHQVLLSGFMLEDDDKDREFITVNVTDPENEELTTDIRMWLHTEGARSYTFDNLRNIYVHNAPADKKDEARETFNAITDGVELVSALSSKLIGKEAWIKVYYDGTTYVNRAGAVKKSIKNDIYGYEPQMKPGEGDDSQLAVDAADYPAEPFDEKVDGPTAKQDGGNTVPSKW